MAAPSTSRDPRSIVTPEAFQISPELLGMPLATPGRRFAAILLDLVFIGIITLVTRSFALVLGIVVAVALVRAATRRTEVRGNVFDRARRLSIGCLGVTVGLATLGLWAALAFDENGPDGDGDLGAFVAEAGDVAAAAEDDREARTGSDAELRVEEPIESRDAQAVRDGVSLYSLEQALDAYVELRRAGTDDPMDRELVEALEERLVAELASDTLSALEDRVSELRRESRRSRARLREAEEELDDAESRGSFGWLGGVLDDLGFGFGWAALYTTVLLTLTNGQTLGKRLLRIRVVRLDGQPINWWIGFERAGGYAAGFATGLLGFAQVYWDANRQAIHDRIVGTVVVTDGADRVMDWEAAL